MGVVLVTILVKTHQRQMEEGDDTDRKKKIMMAKEKERRNR